LQLKLLHKVIKTFRALILGIGAMALCFTVSAQKKKDYTSYVDPFIGTGGHGHTYSGAVAPFGMVQLSPDTRLEGWDGCSGYHYTDSVVYGFSHTHLSGTGIADYCDILFMPTTGTPQFKNTEYSSPFKKKNEFASPGYYKIKLDKYDIDVELTATTRAGMHRYNYPSTAQANIIIDLQHRDQVLDSWIEVINDHEIRGYRESRSWAREQHVYFYAKFSKPFKTYGIALNDQLQTGLKKVQGKNVKLFIQFDNPGEVISKVGISAVSAEGALKNLNAEIPDLDFKKTLKAAKIAWINALAKIEIEGGAPTVQQEQQQAAEGMPNGSVRPTGKKATSIDYGKIKRTIFYTALYHSMLSPNAYSDVDGQYRGMDQKIHTADGFDYYTVFSLWDTFRAEHPLLTLIDRKRTLDFIKSFMAIYDQQGLLPIWSLASNETYCMIGNHSIPVIVDAYAKGIRDFDAEKAFAAMKASVNRTQFGLDSYRDNGLVLADKNEESVSKTLEYAYDDWCIAQMAKMLNKPADYTTYIQRAQYWKNVQNKDNGFVQAHVNGDWFKPFNPTDVNKNYVEGNAWQYTFLVPQDVSGLVKRMGGVTKFETSLNELFTTTAPLTGTETSDITGLIGQYAHGNEPSHHMAYLFNFTDAADKTQFFINRILSEQYSNKPDGLAGNDDCGQMSAWYVMSALGIYNIAPGQQQFQIGLPQFDKAVINLENGKKFTVLNSGSSVARNNIYLQGMSLNKKAYNKLYLNYADIANGGEFEVYTGRLANKMFMQDLEKPTSIITDDLIVPNPIITLLKTFAPPTQAAISSNDIEPNTIYYTIDGSTPTTSSTVYSKPIPVSAKIVIKAMAVKNGKSSFVTEAHF
jgi:putative alpha-1,2-mannosidase